MAGKTSSNSNGSSRAKTRSTTRSRTRTAATASKRRTVAAVQQPVTIDHDRIATRAYELWRANGGGSGHEVENWLQAESQLKAELAAR